MPYRILLALVLVLALAAPARAGAVVVLHSVSEPDGWTRSVADGVCPEGKAGCAVDELFLGPSALGDDFFEERFETFCKAWCNATPEGVIADGETAFAFVRKYREELFPGAPVVYAGMGRPESWKLSQCGNCAGIPLRLDVRGTVDLIFRLRPETGTVVGIVDGSQNSLALKARAEAAMAPHLDSAQIIFPGHEPGDDNGLDLEALASVASSVPGSGAVLFLGFAEDRAGNAVDEAKAVRLVAERSVAPVYVLTDRWMGTGVLGGVLALGQDQGRAAMRLAAKLASDPGYLPEPVPARTVADLTVMARFGIAADRLPADAVTRNAPPLPDSGSGLDPAGAGLLIGAALLGLIGWLLYRRSRAQ